MAGAGFITFTAGSVLTAAQVNTYLMQQAVMVFTNEAARDAAITSPSEGMIAYLTAPTTPQATGTTTMLPTGAKTIYNGSVWVCVSEVGATTGATGTTTSSTYTATLSGSPGTNPSVTLVTGTSALVMLSCDLSNATSGNIVAMSVAVSGAGTVAASSVYACYLVTAVSGAAYINRCSYVGVVSGLSAGTNTFTAQYSSSGGVVGTFGSRTVTVKGIA